MPRVSETTHSTGVLQQIFRLGIWRPVAEQRGIYGLRDDDADCIAAIEQALVERNMPVKR